MQNNCKGYDIIGDIHGCFEQLQALLIKLGYSNKENVFYSHPTRKAIFVGDLIDRGNQQKQVVNLVKAMVDNDAALIVLGNHELNAVAYHSINPTTKQPLRPHNASNIKQHKAFLDAYSNVDELQEIMSWFKSIPLFLDLGDIRIIHACWNDQEIEVIKPLLTTDNCLNEVFLVNYFTDDTAEFIAIETLLKGIELALPKGLSFKDKDDHERKNIRIKWWSELTTYRKAALVPDETLELIPNDSIPKHTLNQYAGKPVFIGHYWLKGEPEIQSDSVCCVDYSAVKSGHLTAYRWDVGDSGLKNNRFIQVKS